MIKADRGGQSASIYGVALPSPPCLLFCLRHGADEKGHDEATFISRLAWINGSAIANKTNDMAIVECSLCVSTMARPKKKLLQTALRRLDSPFVASEPCNNPKRIKTQITAVAQCTERKSIGEMIASELNGFEDH
jgi:hypothetical protein